jgi:hypothetical protein
MRLLFEYWNCVPGAKVWGCLKPYASTSRGVNERVGSLNRSCSKSGSALYGNRPLRISARCLSVIRSPPGTPST